MRLFMGIVVYISVVTYPTRYQTSPHRMIFLGRSTLSLKLDRGVVSNKGKSDAVRSYGLGYKYQGDNYNLNLDYYQMDGKNYDEYNNGVNTSNGFVYLSLTSWF